MLAGGNWNNGISGAAPNKHLPQHTEARTHTPCQPRQPGTSRIVFARLISARLGGKSYKEAANPHRKSSSLMRL